MEKIVAVVTCDVIGSRRYSTDQRRKMDVILKKEFITLSKIFKSAIHTPASLNIIGGDEFQFVLSGIDEAYKVMIFYRSLLAIADPALNFGFRSSIGIGEIAVENKRDSYSQDGQAFHRSRLGMDCFRDHKLKRRTKIVTGDDYLDETLDMILMYQDLIEEKWTRPQWEAVRFRLVLPTYEEIAKKIGVAYQNVQKRLKAANWDEFRQGIDFVEKILALHLKMGAVSVFTAERV